MTKDLPEPISTKDAWSASVFGASLLSALVLIVWRWLLS